MSQKMQAPNLRANRGSAIFMTLGIAVIFAAVVEIGVSSYFQSRSQILDNRVSGTYATLSELITNNSVTFPNNGSLVPLADTLRTSLSQGSANQQLANCIIGSSVASCQDGLPLPLTLYFPILQGGNQPMMAGPGPAGAAGSSPARFDVYGNPCNSTTWTKRCPFEVYAQFTPACGGPGVCNRAVSISVHFQLRGPRGGSYLTSGDGTHLPIFELVSGAIDVNAILPPTPTQIAQNSNGNVQVQQYSGSDDSSGSSTDEIDWSKVNPAIAVGLNTGPLPSNTTEVISALTNSGVTDPTILTILARAWVNEAGDARAIADTITAAGITDVNLMGVLVQGWVEDPAQATQIASELAASGIRYDNIVAQVTLGALVHYGVTDPTTLAAMFNALASQDGLGYYYSAQKVAIAGATEPAQVAAILKEIEGEASSDTSSTTLSSTSGGSDGGSGTSSPGAPAPPPPPPMHTLNTCSGPQCATGY